MSRKKLILPACGLALMLLFSSTQPIMGQAEWNEALLKHFKFRNLGPYRAGSWVTSFAVPASPPVAHLYTFYVGTRNGGLWKTINNGVTFTPVFDSQSMLSIGDVAVAAGDADIVWVGTGEAYCARSSNAGNGVYKSLDGGKTWAHMGLADTQHIARIVIHPTNPDIVYVAAMGHLFTANRERGVFKTVDGGKTWQKVLFINDRVGVIDLAINLGDPEILYAATYDKVRLPWHYEVGGPESAIHKTIDGGRTWSRLAGGLPNGRIGRIGLDIFQKTPDTLYAVVENANKRPATPQEITQDQKRGIVPRERQVGGEVYRTDDSGRSWRKVNAGYEAAFDKAPYSFNQLRIDQQDANKVYITAQSLISTPDGGKTWAGLRWPPDGVFQKAFGDWRTMWVDPQNGDRLIFGSDGGVNVSYDGGKTCHHFYNIPLGEFYAVTADMEDPYNLYGGLQDHDSWKGPTNGFSGEVGPADWVTVGEGDGMYNCVDPSDSRWLYNNREFGTMWRLDQKTGVQTPITPSREKGREPLRFNWTPPIELSPHNPAIVYTAAQVLFRSLDRGDHWQEISPDLTTNDKTRQGGAGNITYCTVTTLSESPAAPGVIWVGTDDGKVQVSRDGGATWLDRTAKLAAAGAPKHFWVSRVFASPHQAGTAFVTKSGIRFDDFRPCLHRTTDYGETWTDLAANLPAYGLNVIIQDRHNADLLFVGSEHGLFLSTDGGKKWLAFGTNLPSVKVTDLFIHPRENDLVVATYGRGLFLCDISPLQEANVKALENGVYLFAIRPRAQRIYGGMGNYELLGDSHLFSENETNALAIHYYLKRPAADKIKLMVCDPYGQPLWQAAIKAEAGLNTAYWDMRIHKDSKAGEDEEWNAPLAEPGEYIVIVEAAGQKLTQKARITKRTGWTASPQPVTIKE